MHEIEGASVWGPIVFGNQAPDSGNSEILAHFGTEEQKKRWLYPLLDGKLRSAFSMTEPNTAGSDPTLLSTTAVLHGDEWVINGHKWFTSNGMIADFLIAMVVTEPDADPYERASMIIVPGRRARTQEAAQHSDHGAASTSDSATATRRSSTRTCACPGRTSSASAGQGFLIAQARLGPGRIHHCMRWLGQARRAFDMMCERALQREAFGKKLAGHQTVQNWIADSAAEMQAARLMTLHAAWVIDTQGAAAARKEISLDQVLRREGAARRDRPRHPDPRLARLLVRPAARGDVPARARGADLRRAGRGAPRLGRAADPGRLPGAEGHVAARAHTRRGARRRGASSQRCSRRPSPMPEKTAARSRCKRPRIRPTISPTARSGPTSNANYTAAAPASHGRRRPHWGVGNVPESEIKVLPDVRGLDVIELGCGTAYFGAWLKRLGARRVVGVDITPAQLDTAREMNEEFGLGLEFIEANAEDVPLPDASFDLAFSEYGASIWCDPYRWIPEAARLLRPGGELLFMRNSTLQILCSPDDEGSRRAPRPAAEGHAPLRLDR